MSSNVQSITRLSSLQEGILFHCLSETATTVYHSQYCCDLTALSVERFRAVWVDTVKRHDSLRTLFTWKNRKNPLQIVRTSVNPKWHTEDWRALTVSEKQEAFERYLSQDKANKFVLDEAPLLRFALFRLSQESWKFVVSFHHLVLDGWSLRILLNDVSQAYSDETYFERCVPPPSFEDYLSYLDRNRGDSPDADAFWPDYLAGIDSPSLLQTRAPGRNSGSGRKINKLSKSLTEKLRETARRHKLTLNTLVLGAWSVVLSQRTMTDDVVFGTTVSGRSIALPRVEEMVGVFINTLPTRIKLERSTGMTDWLSGIQRGQLAIREFEQTPLVDLQRASELPRGTPLFDHIVVFENFPKQSNTEEAITRNNEEFFENSHYPFALLIVDGQEIEFWGVFDRAYFNDIDIELLLEHLVAVIETMAVSLDGAVSDLFVLPASHQARINNAFNNTITDFGAFTPITELIRMRAEECPTAIAAQDEQQTLSYKELWQRAEKIAASLHARGVGPEVPVGIMMNRSCEAVIAITAVMMTGAAYVPLDPNWPPSRHQAVADILSLQSTQPLTVITDSAVDSVGQQSTAITLAALEKNSGSLMPAIEPQADNLAYIIFTSGSTGEPKGVMVDHSNLFNSTMARGRFYENAPKSFLLLSPLTTDSSVAGIFWSLSTGATLVLPGYRAEQEPQKLIDFAVRHHVSHLLALPSLYRALLEYGSPASMSELNSVIVAGESCPERLIAEHRSIFKNVKLYNEYGPSEACVWASATRLDNAASVTLGKPIANTTFRVVDHEGNQVAIGCPGELHIAGKNLARGYVGKSALTKQRFISIPTETSAVERYYKTGDLVRWQADGQLLFLGRTDSQVKIRGYRVELEEIERTISKYPGVIEGAVGVTVVEDEVKDGQLYCAIAFRTNDQGSVEELRSYLSTQLPQYMVPTIFEEMSELPKSGAGKIDRRCIADLISKRPRPVRAVNISRHRESYREVAQKISEIWSEVLGVSDLGLDENFFELGGDSLLSIRILSRMHQSGMELTPEQFFNTPTIAGQTELVESLSAQGGIQILDRVLVQTPKQKKFIEDLTLGIAKPYRTMKLTLEKLFTFEVIEAAMANLVEDHFIFRLKPTENAQQKLSSAEASYRVTESVVNSHADWQSDIPSIATLEELQQLPSLRVDIIRTAPSEQDQISVSVSEYVMDGSSWPQLIGLIDRYLRGGRSPVDQQLLNSWIEVSEANGKSSDAGQSSVFADSLKGAKHVDLEAADGCPTEQMLGSFRALTAEQTEGIANLCDSLHVEIWEVLTVALFMQDFDSNNAAPINFYLTGIGRHAVKEMLPTGKEIGPFDSTQAKTIALKPEDKTLSEMLLRVKENFRRSELESKELGKIDSSNAQQGEARLGLALNYFGELDSYLDTGSVINVPAQCVLNSLCEDAHVSMGAFDIYRLDGKLHFHWRDAGAGNNIDAKPKVVNEFVGALEHIYAEYVRGNIEAKVTPEDFPLADLAAEDLDAIFETLGKVDDDG